MTEKNDEMKESVDIDSAITAYITALRKRGYVYDRKSGITGLDDEKRSP